MRSGTRRAFGALACAIWTAAASAGCLVELDEGTDDDLEAEEIGEEEQAISGSNTGGTNLGGANLGGANLTGTNLGGANLGGANLAATNLGGANLGGANLGGANLGGANLASAGLGGSTAAGAFPGLGCPITGTRNLGSDLTLATTGIDIHNLGTAAKKLLRSGEDVYTRASSCVVLGLGSAAFAKLISQNSGATMYAATQKLPWGFAATSGGAVALSAWEVVVWGSARYAVFVVVAPSDASFAGVAGFIKAVWRWNAPTTKTLKIGQIGGGQTVQSHTGMMNAGAARLANTLTDKAFLAGELAFVTATTNNQTVNVDFASWVRKTDGTSLVLGNVAGTPPWSEGSIMALEKPDGSVAVYFRRPPRSYPQDGIQKLETAYAAWKAGTRTTKPIPPRCAGWLYLKIKYKENIPVGKCDPYLIPSFDTAGMTGADFVFGAKTWTASGLTAAPYNDYMLLDSPTDTTTPVMSACTREHPTLVGHCAPGSGPFPILSETYVHLWDAPYTPYP